MHLGLYRHYKGDLYQVMGIARHSESLEEMVVYRALYNDFGIWVRPKAMFSESIMLDNKLTPRFTFIRPLDLNAPEV